ncbi:hypothetical protein HMPREF0208_01290 [Citrobacter koseri]|nr:hypothetical protein HMPREF3207_00259 [Citrobacter koseri]KXB45546.1 hypothetical protein HMPREF0208_01290 [Citrobacter koseri]
MIIHLPFSVIDYVSTYHNHNAYIELYCAVFLMITSNKIMQHRQPCCVCW